MSLQTPGRSVSLLHLARLLHAVGGNLAHCVWCDTGIVFVKDHITRKWLCFGLNGRRHICDKRPDKETELAVSRLPVPLTSGEIAAVAVAAGCHVQSVRRFFRFPERMRQGQRSRIAVAVSILGVGGVTPTKAEEA